MNADKQRIAIARAHGWRVGVAEHFKLLCRPGEIVGVCCGSHLTEEAIFSTFLTLGDCGLEYVIPNYPSDLNAMHEAEKTLVGDSCFKFLDALQDVIARSFPNGNDSVFWTCVHATAAQRAEAFLRTIGKWEDGE